MSKRKDYLNWDEYFMGIALLSSYRSKDPNTQVGACIVNDKNRIMSVGYNGFPYGCDDDEFPWERSGDAYDTKYPYVCHAELNAILNNRGANLEGAKIYVALFPCNECAKAIIQSGIKEVVYLSDKYADTMATRASKRMFNAAGVKLTKIECGKKSLVIDLDENKV
ncbi:MAG: dCMP deaminase family protein [Clostridia bacterium]|nr:dCMP deaminase family protein [Clostridia bacterium]